MKKNRAWLKAVALVFLLLPGCRSKEDTAAQTDGPSVANPPAAQEAATPGPQSPTTAISAARNSLKAGHVDDAAARLAELQLQRARFNAQQAKDYRQALSEAYDRTLEAAQRGDPRAQAALQLLRAAAPR